MKTRKSERGLQSYKKGLWAERLAIFSLRLKGHRVLEKRYKTPGGEIDLITETFGHIIFTEVKARPTLSEAAYALTLKQQQRLHNAALYYLQKKTYSKKMSFRCFSCQTTHLSSTP
ncbi:YraN family protein [Alphaproteobacteria bacterium]|jgi:putative endonuclease|nr:YraN family protein [Alphaproteobacteria bacterium]